MRNAVMVAALAVGSVAPALAQSAAVVGKPAPEFTLKDSSGQSHALSTLRGKYVVLEWVNFGCPFVQKHYGSGNMQKLQKAYTGKGVVWLSVNSSATGKQGYYPAAELAAVLKEKGAAPTAYLLDTGGKAGRLYGARTTPHMFVIDPKGTLVYAGGIDDIRSTNPADVKTAKNYVRAAMGELLAGKSISNASTQPYGCSIKY